MGAQHLRLVRGENDPQVGYALEVYMTAAIVIGAAATTTWRPQDDRLHAIVGTVAAVARATSTWPVDLVLVADTLRRSDPSWAWSAQLHHLLCRYDEVRARVTQRGPILARAKLAQRALVDLDVKIDKLLAARTEVECAIRKLDRECVAIEQEVATW